MVRFCDDLSVFHAERVVILTAAQPCGGKARAEFHALDRRNGKYRARNAVFQPPEHRIADPCREPLYHALDHAADGVLLRLCLCDLRLHGSRRLVRDGRERLFVDRRVKRRIVRYRADRHDPRPHPDALSCQYLQAEPAGNAQRRCQPAGKMSAARTVLRAAELDLRGIVRVAGAGDIHQIFIVAGARIRVADDGCERRAAGPAVLQPA